MRGWISIAAALSALPLLVAPAWADTLIENPLHACERAAARAEADWHLPAGLLSAIGLVESGRGDLGVGRPVAWPWSVNAGGRGFQLQNKPAAIQLVRELQAIGWQAIDVGCFQVDLYYHPEAFPTLEAAFDPDANAGAAARILARERLSSPSWEMAVARYHSASPLRGALYLGRVRSVLPWTRRIPPQPRADEYAALLSPAARSVRVISPADAPAPQQADLPRVLGPDSASVLQWVAVPAPVRPAGP